jgi:hypothetical protein
MNTVLWRQPPQPDHRPGPLYFKLLHLQERPGAWAEIGRYASVNAASATASRLRTGTSRRPEGDFEFTTRTERGRGVLYARYLPTDWNGGS